MFQLTDFWYVERQGKLRKSVATTMTEQFHQQLNQLALEAREFPLESRQRKRIIDKIGRIILNSPELKKHKRKLFREYSTRDSNVNQAVFQACYPDALQNTFEFVVKKINNYNPGKGYILGLDWQEFDKDLQNNPEDSSALVEDFKEKIDCYRQTTDKSLKIRQDYQPEKSEELKSLCTNFANSIDELVETNSYSTKKIENLWRNFFEQITTYDCSKDLFNWFKFILRYRFIDCKNEFLNYKFKRVKALDSETGETIINPKTGKPKYRRILLTTMSLDEPGSNDRQGTMSDTLPANKIPDQTLQNLIEEDPDDIFTAKHLRNYPEVNFREIQLLHSKNYSCKEILAHFNNKIPLGTISSQYHRSFKYFYPILEEYEAGIFPLTESTVNIIREDLEIRTGDKGRRKPSDITMKERADINFQSIIIQRKDSFCSWTLLAKHLNVSSKDLILFYLDNLQKSKLYQTLKKRRQQQ